MSESEEILYVAMSYQFEETDGVDDELVIVHGVFTEKDAANRAMEGLGWRSCKQIVSVFKGMKMDEGAFRRQGR